MEISKEAEHYLGVQADSVVLTVMEMWSYLEDAAPGTKSPARLQWVHDNLGKFWSDIFKEICC